MSMSRLRILFVVALLGACAGPPARTPAAAQPVVSATGPLPAKAGEALLDRRLEQHADDPHVQALIDAFRAQAKAPLVAGNRVTLLVDGPQTLGALRAAIETARHYIHLETYIFADDRVGREFRDLLSRRRQEGVQVRVLYDALGSLATSEDFFAPLRAVGGEVLAYRPVNPVRTPPWRANTRDHRKILIVDGHTAFTGGVNISSTYASSSTKRPGPEAGREEAWRDTHLQIEGPSAAHFQALFTDTWRRAGGELSEGDAAYTPKLDARGRELVAAVATLGGDRHEATIYATYVAIVGRASRRLWLTQAYFAPDQRLREALIAAAQRGVDVRLIVPGFTDSALIFHASRATYDELLAGGVRIFEQRDALLHAKTLVADGALSIVGSANFDMRSFLHNHEVNAVVIGADFAHEMERLFKVDLHYAHEVTRDVWRKRSALDRLKEVGSRLFYYWL